jgi:hypothetical protein
MSVKENEAPKAIYQIKVTLLGTKPPIWRRLLVPAEFTLAQLHDVLQTPMGWEDCHLHEFRIDDERYGVPDPHEDFGEDCIHERKARISKVLEGPGARAEYTYDFGDTWEHAVVVEKILTPESGVVYPLCTAGKLHGPPEDCGGIGGFYDFLEAIRDPEHEQHKELLGWIGGNFDPESFSLDAVNQRLHQMLRPARKTAAKRAAPKSSCVIALSGFRLAAAGEQSDRE